VIYYLTSVLYQQTQPTDSSSSRVLSTSSRTVPSHVVCLRATHCIGFVTDRDRSVLAWIDANEPFEWMDHRAYRTFDGFGTDRDCFAYATGENPNALQLFEPNPRALASISDWITSRQVPNSSNNSNANGSSSSHSDLIESTPVAPSKSASSKKPSSSTAPPTRDSPVTRSTTRNRLLVTPTPKTRSSSQATQTPLATPLAIQISQATPSATPAGAGGTSTSLVA